MNIATLKTCIVRIFFSVLFIGALSACKELDNIKDKVQPLLDKHTQSSDQFSSEQIVEAIKQALSQGVGDSINLLGSAQGFSLSDLYHIPIPGQLEKPAGLLRKLGQGKQVDEFEGRLNLAAEASVKKALPVFKAAITDMSVDDALSIMKGSENAATLYFKDKTEATLRSEFLPIIQSATEQTGLTSSYKSLSSKVSNIAPGFSTKMVDIDEYVLGNAMNALFDRVAQEEKMIRQDPAKRGTDLMKSVYGYFSK